VIAEKAQLKHIDKQADVVSVPTKPKKKTQQERGVVTIFVCGSQVLTKLFLSFGSQTLLHTPQYCFDLYNCQTQHKQQTNHHQKLVMVVTFSGFHQMHFPATLQLQLLS
jgi:hypothetical protein